MEDKTVDINFIDTIKPIIEQKRSDCPLDLFGSSVEMIMSQFMTHKSIVEGAFQHINNFLESQELKDFLSKFNQVLFDEIEKMMEVVSEFAKTYFEDLFKRTFASNESSPYDGAAVKKAFEIIESSINEIKFGGK